MPLKPPLSSAARKTIKTAFDQLDRTIRPEDSHDFPTTTLENVKKAALDIEDQLAARRSLRNMRRLLPLFASLEHYAKVMDILCNGTPFLPWIWAPITLVLRIASEYVEAFEKIIKGYSRIADSLGRFKILHVALGANQDFQQTLAAFYANILQFHEHAYAFVRRKSWRLLFLTSWGRFQRRFDNILDEMKRHEELVDLQASAHSISDVRQMREDIKYWREENLTQVQKWHEKQASKQYDSIVTWLKSEESDQLAILDTISSEGAKFAGTCSWVLKDSRMRSWLHQKPDSPVLWLQGTPGSGKSVLASQIVKFMKNASMFLIHHFCSQRYASSTTYEQILRSILLQLLRKDDELIAHVYEDYVLGKKPPTIQALEKLLYNLSTMASRVPCQSEYIWIIIDGLNECETRTQGSVVNLINQITSKLSGAGDTICKILVSSRSSSHIAKRLRTKQIISLTEEKASIRLAIRQYVSQRLRTMQDKLAQLELTRKDIDDVERVITNKADGMFLYARLVLDYLSKNIFFSGKEMKKSIDELPKELSELYAHRLTLLARMLMCQSYRKILIQILVQLDPRSVERIKCVFSWIAFAKRPLKRMEFLSALTFSVGNPEVTNLVPRYILEICGALVEERPDTTLAFIHISVKEFLQSPLSNIAISETEATTEHCLSTLACLLCGVEVFLGKEAQHTKALRVVKGIHGFHVYATEFWTEYLLHHAAARSFDGSSAVLDLALRLANKLNELTATMNTMTGQELKPLSAPVDERMRFLEEWPLLGELVDTSLRARSLKKLESNLIHELQHATDTGDQMTSDTKVLSGGKQPCDNASVEEKDSISLMLSSYQAIVRFLLKQDQYPGISADDLDLFKSQFQSSAFTCRLSFCPRATAGFVLEELRRQHEIAHTQLSVCTVPDCKYPPFASIRALKNHINKYHRPEPIRRPIRRVGHLSLLGKRGGLGVRSGSRSPISREESPERPGTGELSASLLAYSKADKLAKQPGRARGHIVLRENARGRRASSGGARSPDSSPLNDIAQIPDGNGGDASNLDEMVNVRIDSIGFRGCAIPGCGMRLGTGNGEGPYSQDAHEFMSFHYWNWHHADSMAQCAVSRCQMIFSRNEGLQAHYEQRHTTLFCERCDANCPDGFALEDELRHHWRSNHLRLVEKWMCDDPRLGAKHSPLVLPYDSCESCRGERKFNRRYDAIKHLKSEHFNTITDSPQEPLSRFLCTCVRMVRVYKAVESEETWRDRRVERPESEVSDEEDYLRVDSMFYVKELA